VVTALIATLYVIVAIGVDLRKYAIFAIGGDTALHAQMLWNTLQGNVLAKTSVDAAVDHLRGGHMEPIMLLLALPYALDPDPCVLLVAQILAIAAGSVLVYGLCRLHGGEQRVAVALVAAYFLYPIVQYATINDFHPDPLAVPALLGALYAFDTRRWHWLALCLTLVLLTKEQMPVLVLGLGVYWWRWRGAPRVGLFTIAAALVYALAVLLPWFFATAGEFTRDYTGYFSELHRAWEGGPGLSDGFAARGYRLVQLLTEPFRMQNVFWALLPSGLLFLLDPVAVVLFLPLAGLYVADPMVNYYFYHHYIIVVPFALYGTVRVLSRNPFRTYAWPISLVLVAWTTALCVSYSANPLNLMHWMHQPSLLAITDRTRAQEALLAAIPAAGSVDADSSLTAHLANRRYLFLMQNAGQARLAQYVALDLHTDLAHPPLWLVGLDRSTLALMQHVGGCHGLRADPRYGLYLYVNCTGFPATPGCPDR
jgi:uncharacterized membrane protein